jgi:hypothetical protein
MIPDERELPPGIDAEEFAKQNPAYRDIEVVVDTDVDPSMARRLRDDEVHPIVDIDNPAATTGANVPEPGDGLDELTNEELRERLEDADLPTSGNKEELIARLRGE